MQLAVYTLVGIYQPWLYTLLIKKLEEMLI